jgi:hypothetical protein
LPGDGLYQARHGGRRHPVAAPGEQRCHTSHTNDVDRGAISLPVHRPGSAERGASIRRLYDLPILDRRAA